ncbi:Ras-related protein Rab-18 [Schistosoma bovis]|uniref:Ras-related protein Rab-18 n=1 Tax=Schistosoma bovis TaxID=6184 RepID=A0A430PZR4_SCHBO|nr:Ras-related protein Rab-18 [Schistosoma bovis]RTG89514.1 Ras-related protein Rab-18 [Schistosoma bovis]
MHRNGNELLINFKLLLIGDSGVGKSSLLMRYTNDCFESQLSATIGVDFKVKLVTVPDGTKIKLSIWISREISREEGLRFARLYSMPYAETSAKTSEGVNQLFSDVVTRIYNHSELWNQGKKRAINNSSSRAHLTELEDKQTRSGCCS